MRESGGSVQTVPDRKKALGFAGWEEGKLLDNTTSRDYISDRFRWSPFLVGWNAVGTMELFASKHKKQKVNVGDVVKSLLEAVHGMVKVAQQHRTHPTTVPHPVVRTPAG